MLRVRKKYIMYNACDSSESVTVGLYFPNGILHETARKTGIGNFVDVAIFERLSTEEFLSDTRITGHTYYHYSEFLLTSSRKTWKEEFTKLADIILDPNINQNLVTKVQGALRQNLLGQDQDIDDLYNEQYYCLSRLSKPIIGDDLETIKSFTVQEVQEYQRQYYALEKATLCVTGSASAEDVRWIYDTNAQSDFADLKNQGYGKRGNSDIIIVKTDWNDSDILISFDCPETANSDFLLLEVFCCICEKILNRLSYQSDSSFSCYEKPKLYLDYATPKIIFKLTTKNNGLKDIFQSVLPALQKEIHHLDPVILSEAIDEVIDNYAFLTQNSSELNLWMGWNSMIGEPYDLKLLPFKDVLCKRVSLKGILQCLRQCIRSQNAAIALTNNPATISDEEIRKIIKDWRTQFS